MSQPITKVLEQEDKMINEAENILSRLWRIILLDLGIGTRYFSSLVSQYLTDPNNGIRDDPIARSNHRGNLVKELGGDRMSWSVFEKALRVLGVEEFKLTIQLKRRKRKEITQHDIIVLNTFQEEQDPDDLSNAVVVEEFCDPVEVEIEESRIVNNKLTSNK